MDQHNAWDFENTSKFVQTEVGRFQTKGEKPFRWTAKTFVSAIILINRPDLLILDEPTNHLDLEMIEWLEAYFAKENITLFMVTTVSF
jgi:ATP-binding cassette subfamily F protein uup